MEEENKKSTEKKEREKVIVFSLCSRCNKKIKFGKEIQLEDSMNCEDCFHAIIGRCHNCNRPIYKDELGYEITPN
jgi:DNA-directed RNA polymerase subunit RPC12/RpoP